MGVASSDLARDALDGLFRRRVEAEKVYCSSCLVVRLTRTFPLAAAQAAGPPGLCKGPFQEGSPLPVIAMAALPI
jgi:hypothetical protein